MADNGKHISREEIQRLDFEFVKPDAVPKPDFHPGNPKWQWLYDKLLMVVDRSIQRPFKVGPFTERAHCAAGQTAVHNFKSRYADKVTAGGWSFDTAATVEGGLWYFYVTPSKGNFEQAALEDVAE